MSLLYSEMNEDDVLRAMIASDPDTVMKFFTGLSNSMHGKLNELMAHLINKNVPDGTFLL